MTADPCLTAFDEPACTLPTVDRPVRAESWRGLLARARSAVSGDPRSAVFEWAADAETAAAAADLASREVACCAFFSFGLEIDEGSLRLRASVPPGHEPVVTGLLRLAGR